MQHVRLLPLMALTAVALASVNAATINQSFQSDPQSTGWQMFGNTNLFQWNSTNQNLEVTWDSTQPNSYFYHPLGTTLSRSDDFQIDFDLLLKDIASGTEPGKTGGMEIGAALLNFGIATNTNFMRGDFGNSPSLAEFTYFPTGYYNFDGEIFPSAATTTPTFISTNEFNYAPTLFAPYSFELPTNVLMHISMCFTASNQTVVTTLKTNGSVLVRLPDLVLTDSQISDFTDSDDFVVDTFAICNYSNAGDDFDSVLGHGTIANISVSYPMPAENLTGSFSNGVWVAQFSSRSNWLYTLERSTDLQSWAAASISASGASSNFALQDTNPPAANAFYRVRATRQ